MNNGVQKCTPLFISLLSDALTVGVVAVAVLNDDDAAVLHDLTEN